MQGRRTEKNKPSLQENEPFGRMHLQEVSSSAEDTGKSSTSTNESIAGGISGGLDRT
jgi:hypothetical protein